MRHRWHTHAGRRRDHDGPQRIQPHIRSKDKRRKLANRFKDAKDPFHIVIVRDMWLTGFDAPCLHTMYADKPMQGHGLMQAIARVKRVFRDKPGGLVLDSRDGATHPRQVWLPAGLAGGRRQDRTPTGGTAVRLVGACVNKPEKRR